jgi:chromosome segregation ATPase
VVINFALAVAFLVFTLTVYSKRVKYAEKVKVAQDEKAAVELAKKNLEADLTAKLTKAEADKKAALDLAGLNEKSARDLNMQIEKLQKDEVDARNTAKAITDQKGVLLEQVQKMRAELEATREVVMKLKTDNTKLQMDTDEYKKQLVDAQNEDNKLKADINDLHRDRQRLAEDLANAEYVLKEMAKRGHTLPQVASIPEVKTKVVDVRNTGNVALGAGSASGIKEGVIFLISRKDKYIGKVRVTTVWDDFAGGQVIEQKEPMMPGDDALSTRGS